MPDASHLAEEPTTSLAKPGPSPVKNPVAYAQPFCHACRIYGADGSTSILSRQLVRKSVSHLVETQHCKKVLAVAHEASLMTKCPR